MRLGFYLNPVIQLRGSQSQGEPDPVTVASLAEMAGVEVILIGWNPNGGLITERDVKLVREVVRCDLIFIVPLLEQHIEPVIDCNPNGVVLVDSSWDGLKPVMPVQQELEANQLTDAIAGYRNAGMPVFPLIEPVLSSIKIVARARVSGVVLDCSKYANAQTDEEAEMTLEELNNAAMATNKFGLVTGFMHGLNYRNIGHIAGLSFGDELYVGRTIANRALLSGLEKAISDMNTVIFRRQMVSR